MTSPATSSLTSKVAKGAIWTMAGQLVPLVSSFISTPVVIRLLGTERYGVFALISQIPNYTSFADFGMSLASTTFASEAYAKGSAEDEKAIVKTAATISLISSVITASILVAFADLIIRGLLRIPDHLYSVALIAVYLSSVAVVGKALSGVVNTPQLVRLRMDLNSLINAVSGSVQIVCVVTVIYLGGGVVGAVASIAAVSILNVLAHTTVSVRLGGNFFTGASSTEHIRPLLRFGAGTVAFTLGIVLLGNVEKVVVTRYVSISAFAHYSVAFTLANLMGLFSTAMIQSLIPAFSQLRTGPTNLPFQQLYSRGIRFNLVFFAPVAMVFCLVAEPFFTLWAGPEFGAESTLPFYILGIGWIANVVALVPFSALLASKHAKPVAILVWIEIIPYLLLTINLTVAYGAMGTAVAWSIRALVDSILQLLLARRICGLRISSIRQNFLGLLLGYLLLGAPILLHVLMAPGLLLISVLAVVSIGLYFLLIWKTVLFTDERIFLREKMRGLSLLTDR